MRASATSSIYSTNDCSDHSVFICAATFCALAFAPAAKAEAPLLSAVNVAERIAETPQLSEIAVSPDGAWVTYISTQRSVTANERTSERLLQSIPPVGRSAPKPVSLKLPDRAAGVRWRPDSRCLSVVYGVASSATTSASQGFGCYDIATGALTPLPVRGKAVSTNYKWSPQGNFVAFAAPLAERAPLDPRHGVPHGLIEPGTPMALFILDVRNDAVTQLTPDSLNVSGTPAGNFDWAPDEHALVVAIDREINSWGYNTDLVTIDRASRRVQPLVTRPGEDAVPRWSPDGRWIAFSTHHGDPAYRDGWPAVIRADGEQLITFPRDTTPMGAPDWWSADSRAFYYKTGLDMTQSLVRADLALSTMTVLPSFVRDLSLVHEGNFSPSGDIRLMAFTRESVTTPAELLTVALDANGRAVSPPRPLTRLTSDFEIGRLVNAEARNWPSRDGRFTIHALLLTPSAHVLYRPQGPLPTLLYFVGGPSMVSRGFADDWNGLPLALAARGYAVLMPNTRGRAGYGVEFWDAIRSGKNRARDPLEDALAGLDMLIEQGVANPNRLGVLGHSYGAYMTAYTITQTNRFKAAVVHDGRFFLTTGAFFDGVSGTDRLLSRDLFGIHNPFDADERARLVDESPGLHADRVRTPTLLLSAGKRSLPWGSYGASFPNPVTDSIPFYNGLRRFNVPAALFVYDEPHAFVSPASIADNLTRTAEWLDYWVRGMAFPDPVRAAQYGQ